MPQPGRAQSREELQSPRSQGVFRNCAQARAAGAAPVRRGDPGYGPHLNRDNDGVGCEPYRGR
ncbi:MAG: excalibur calcium-binding domain-containing protein [Luteimonas sp.]